MTTAPGQRRRSIAVPRVAVLDAWRDGPALRILLVACQAAAVISCWPLWQSRHAPPELPAIGLLAHLPMGWLVLASLVVVVVRPRVGLPLHATVLVLALAADQLRLQPEWISLALLLLATGPWRWCRTLAWAHLSSLWLWSGLNKALSSGFTWSVPGQVAHNLGWAGARSTLAWGIPAMEIGLGLLALTRRTRWVAGIGAVALHGGAILSLRMGFNWPIMWWNVGLACASLVLLTDRRPDPGTTYAGAARGVRDAAVVALFVYPAGAYLGLVDPYLAHQVFTTGVPSARVCEARYGCSSLPIDLSGAALKAPIPPSARLYENWFRRTCHAGQTLEVRGLQVRTFLRGLAGAADHTTSCPSR